MPSLIRGETSDCSNPKLDLFTSVSGVLTDIYSAGEDPIPGISADAVAEQVRKAGGAVEVVPALADVPAHVARMAREGDLVLTMGAGSIGGLGPKVLEAIRSCR